MKYSGILRSVERSTRLWQTVWQMTACTIGSRIDYCNSLSYGMTDRNLNKLQRVHNRTARIVCGTGSQQTSSSQQLHHLHWLPVQSRIQFKLSTLCFRSRTLNQPQYLSDTLHSYQPTLLLRLPTQDLLSVPRCKTVFGGLSFAAPRVWNSLPKELRNCETLGTFKKHLKTH